MNIRTLYQKLFLSNLYFTIALRKHGAGITSDRKFSPDYIMPAKQSKWAADPILADHAGKTYLFYEAVENGRGHIEVSEVREDCTLSEPKVILKDNVHYSYPFVFQKDGVWYMIPETSEAREVRLYRAVDFPEKWELHTVLLRERTVDTTVFEHEGQYYLLTFLVDGMTERVSPRAYRLSWGENIQMQQIAWKEFDELRVRGAGPLWHEEDRLIRPAQISQEQRYGDGLVFYSVDLSDGYTEEPVFEMTSADLKIRGRYADGLHTYCASERFESIDIRLRDLDLKKPIKKLTRKLGK